MSQPLTFSKSESGLISIITLNQPEQLNALDNQQYLELGKLIEKADRDPDTIITLIRSSGRYFSAGANISDPRISSFDPDAEGAEDLYSYWLSKFVSRNVWLTQLFLNHSKVLVAALNGPVIGLTSALVATCDLVYAMNEKVFLLTPFSNLGLVCEGSASASLVVKLGVAKANEAILMSKPITASELYRLGFLNELYDMQDVQEFNVKVERELEFRFNKLVKQSVLDNKKLINATLLKQMEHSNVTEAIVGFNKWVKGIPQRRFRELAAKDLKHKM
ncbi:3,2-trans-enoyl-CoA isomerase, involved in beta-oxidation of unsaturated fatty acids [Komagataella phaffii CBS 7435]|uniref:3,2-trans-enoyl-CoA isomerase n=2 Tax=Komagataella phaffii TaxID=460519 RepID=C4QXT8_KOMPG|nr:uncharacterized protein PAS_chr1-4_0663 [Komagataella phaffii GS115]AOA60422.1 GQ67_01949T0 [Komagataella phaffii]CAH2446878.1 3,2-trans-enoyl-CoA isomerase, involved in beta-oxidation of unsaturated fatty acids [Komagataella phaffii CBS 7435]AOA65841.1 GQ68_01964T0 [Komagataella phaffii GS115]CAY68061.1 hypothetical protein PAS_chr1-4_0663 [Komagataella phaffii GS115]CCA37136.1 3,2-trans-enoyl-CoA isomerase, involved in beta-oxidation of unsaturated fatty acids [Komagataella phaffii CBS 74